MHSASTAFAPSSAIAYSLFHAPVSPLAHPPSPASRPFHPRIIRAVHAPAAQPRRTPLPQRHADWLVTVCGGCVESEIESVLTSYGGRIEKWRTLGAQAREAEVYLPFNISLECIRSALFDVGRSMKADVILQSERSVRNGKRLAVFDLDSTLIVEETIDELAQEAGVASQVKEITVRAMHGEIGFREALSARVGLLKGLEISALERVKNGRTYTSGAREIIGALRAMGCTTAVVSGGFEFLADHVRDELGMDYSFSNRLEVRNGKLTGRTCGNIVDAEFKRDTLLMLKDRLKLTREEIMAVGDGSNDVLMIQRAGLGVAFNAKPALQKKANARLNQPSLYDVLYLLGLDDDEIQRLVQ